MEQEADGNGKIGNRKKGVAGWKITMGRKIIGVRSGKAECLEQNNMGSENSRSHGGVPKDGG